MKKFGKILAVLLSLVVAVTALVVIGAADDSGSDVTTVTTVEDFVAAVNAGKNIKLGADIDMSAAFTADWVTISNKTVVIDLGGKALTMGSRYFNVNSGDLTITGEGTIYTVGAVANVCSESSTANEGKCRINGTGNGITVIPTATQTAAVFTVGTTDSRYIAKSEMVISGKITVKPYNEGDTYMFAVGGARGTSFDDAATLTVDGATIVVTEPTNGSRTASADKNSGMTFAKINDGSNVVIKNSDITMEHGHFIVATSIFTHNAYVDATGSNGQVTAVTGTVPDFTAKIDIDDSKIAAYNSGYSKVLGDWGNSTPGGTLFGIGWNPVEIRVDNTDLVGSNRAMGCGQAARGVYKLSPTYYYFTNVNFTGTDLSTYTSNWLVQEHVNMKWDGGVIEHKNATAKVAFNLSGSDVASDPYGATAIAAAKAAGYIKNDEDIWNYYFCANPKSGLWGSVTNCYVTFTTSGYGVIAQNGTYYNGELESAPAGWSGILFSNCYFVTAPATPSWVETAGTQSGAYTLGGVKYTNVSVIKDGELVTYPVACSDTRVFNRTSMLDDGVGYTNTSGTTSGTKKFGDVFESNTASGKYEETTAGYVKLSIDESTKTGNNHYLGIWYFGSGNNLTYNGSNGSFVVSEFDIATDTGYYVQGGWTAIGRNHSFTYLLDGTELKATQGSRGILHNQEMFWLAQDGTLTLNGGTGTKTLKDGKTSVKLPTDGTWTRITIVYETVATPETYCPVEGSELTSTRYDLSGTKAHIFINGEWVATKTGFITKKLDEKELATYNLDSLRNSYGEVYPTNGTASTCLDNVSLSYYTSNNAAKAEGITAIKNNGASAVSLADYKNDFLVMPAASKIEKATANVNWVIGGETVGTTTPLAGSTVSGVAPEASVLAQANALRNELNNGWFDYGFSGWKVTDAEGNELTSTDTLTKDATYTFTAVCDKLIAPAKGVSGIKINLSLRLNFDLNFYVPVPGEALGVSNVTIKNGNTRLNSGTNDGGSVVYDTVVTIYGASYTKHRDTYGVAELTSETYTLSYTVGSTVFTQDIVYGVSDYVGQYMTQSKDDGETVPRTLIMQMVNYAVKVVNHEDSGVTKTSEISEVIAKYEELLAKYPTLLTTTEKTYFTTDTNVLGKIESSKKSIWGTDEDGNVNTTAPDTKVAYYLESPAIYFATGTPKFIFKYTDAAVQKGIKAPASNDMTNYGGTPGIFAYTGYSSKATQGKHLAYAGGIGSGTKQSYNASVWGDSTKTDGSVAYYVTMIDDIFRGSNFAVYELLKNVQIDLNLTYSYEEANDETGLPETKWGTKGLASGGYCLEWYINGIITGGADEADVELAIALYDYAKVAYQYVYGTAYVPTTV